VNWLLLLDEIANSLGYIIEWITLILALLILIYNVYIGVYHHLPMLYSIVVYSYTV